MPTGGVPDGYSAIGGNAAMRIDKLLWFLRFVKTRALAQALVGEGRLRVDGRRVERASLSIRPGSVLTLSLGGDVRVIRILALPRRRGPAEEARACYEEAFLVPQSGGQTVSLT